MSTRHTLNVNARQRVPKEAIQAVAEQIAIKFRPEKIILFGSYAYGQPRPTSDVDLLVIMDSPLRNREQAVQIARSVDYHFGLDLLVRRPLCVSNWDWNEEKNRGMPIFLNSSGIKGEKMPMTTEVVLDKRGYVMLPPDILAQLRFLFSRDDTIKLLCTIRDHRIILAPPQATQSALEQDWLEQKRQEFLRSPMGRRILAEVEKARENIPSIEQVRQALNQDRSSWAVDIIAEREDRV